MFSCHGQEELDYNKTLQRELANEYCHPPPQNKIL